MIASRIFWSLASLFVAACFVGIWQLVANAGVAPAVFLPGPDVAWEKLVVGFETGAIAEPTIATVRRMIYGWLLASLLGIAIGALIGISPLARAYLTTTVELFRPLPASAMVPVAIAFLGLTDIMVLAVIAFGGVWPMILATIHGFAVVEPRLMDLSRSLGLSRIQVIMKILLPSAMPDIFAGLRLSVAIALILSVVGEMLTNQQGLGSWILHAGRLFRSGDMYAGIILLGVLGFVSAGLLAWCEHYTLRWRRPD